MSDEAKGAILALPGNHGQTNYDAEFKENTKKKSQNDEEKPEMEGIDSMSLEDEAKGAMAMSSGEKVT